MKNNFDINEYVPEKDRVIFVYAGGKEVDAEPCGCNYYGHLVFKINGVNTPFDNNGKCIDEFLGGGRLYILKENNTKTNNN